MMKNRTLPPKNRTLPLLRGGAGIERRTDEATATTITNPQKPQVAGHTALKIARPD